MSLYECLKRSGFSKRIERPDSVFNIPEEGYLVYILSINDESPIVLGHGKKNRAKVIFDSTDTITKSHIKALKIRLHLLYGSQPAVFGRYIIKCEDKAEAKKIEATLHREVGGNTLHIPDDIEKAFLLGIDENTSARMILRIAMCSSFDGISDLKKWQRAGILPNDIWFQISKRLKLV